MYMYTHQRPFIMNNFLSNKRNQVTENQKAGTGLAYIMHPSIFSSPLGTDKSGSTFLQMSQALLHANLHHLSQHLLRLTRLIISVYMRD